MKECKCAVCGKKEQLSDQHTTIIIHHNYGSAKDGDVETFHVCNDCQQKMFQNLKPAKIEKSW